MTKPAGRRWPAPTGAATTHPRHGSRSTAVGFSPVGWWFVTWRARVLDESTGNVEARLSVVAGALDGLDAIGGLPGVRFFGPSGVVFEFWYQAASAREAFGGARAALRHACAAAQVGDPTPHTSSGTADVMLMLEELPTLHQDGS